MMLQNLTLCLLAIALILHVIEEGWLPEYQKRFSSDRTSPIPYWIMLD